MSSKRLISLLAPALLTACAGQPMTAGTAPPVTVQVVAFNDFHGALAPPHQSVTAPARGGGTVAVPAGGAAYLADAVASLRAREPNTVVVAAGDLIGASPLASALFLDEPSIEAMNLVGLEYSALGNHEFDKGRAELLRMAHGGCAKLSPREPCQLDSTFPGARFSYLAANTLTENGTPLFDGYAIKTFGKGRRQVKLGLIGLTLRAAPSIVTPAGVAGLTFTDEADAANALVPRLRAVGADAIVVLIHQGGQTDVGYDDKSCAGLSGDILPILARLDPAIDLVVSGHTHRSYICDYARPGAAGPLLLTSAGNNGTLVTDIRLRIDPKRHRVIDRQADNLIVQSEGYTGSRGPVPVTDQYPRYQPIRAVAALVARYEAAAGPRAARPAGHLIGAGRRPEEASSESALGDLLADAQLAATRAPDAGNAQIAFTNAGGIRADLTPAADDTVTYGQIFAVQPFGNVLTVKSMTGRQILAVLEQQFVANPARGGVPYLLLPSSTFRYSYDLARAPGARIIAAMVEGVPLDPDKTYRVTMNGFLASGGDGFPAFRDGTDPLGGPQDVDALERYLSGPDRIALPVPDRVRNLGAK